jgi:glycosyltransferase involved in cell wall biosynthesis
MKILIQNSLYYPNVIGGAEISTHLLGQELRRRGIAADAVACTGRLDGDPRITTRPTADGLGTVYEAPAHGLSHLYEAGAPAPQAGFLVRGLNHFAQVHSRRWARLFDQVLEQVRPSLVHTNTIVGLTPAVWAAARRHGIPVVHTLRDYHLLCPRTTLLRSAGTDCTDPPLPCRILARLKLRQTGQLALVTAPSDFVLQKHLAAGGFPGAATAVVPNALEEWPPEVPPRRAEGPVRGLFLGQIHTHKGVAMLLEVLADLFGDPECDRLEFDFAGKGPLVPRVKEFCAAHPHRARYHGLVQGRAKQDLLAAASFLTAPSIWAEPFNRSIIDGFSWGLPAVGFGTGGIPEVITHEQDGLVTEPEAGLLREAMASLTRDDARRLALGHNARRRAEDFTLDRQADRFVGLYSRILEQGGAHAAQA